MASSETEIANLALRHLGISKEIANLETEQSNEATAMRRFYDEARDNVLNAFKWPFATRCQALALIEEDPTTEWAFSYRYPVNCVRFLRILSGIRNDSRQTRTPYRIVNDTTGQGLLIYTDMEDAVGEFVYREDNPAQYPADFTMSLSYLLAHYASPSLTKGDQFSLGRRALQLFEIEVSKAEARAANEEQAEEDPESEFIRERG